MTRLPLRTAVFGGFLMLITVWTLVLRDCGGEQPERPVPQPWESRLLLPHDGAGSPVRVVIESDWQTIGGIALRRYLWHSGEGQGHWLLSRHWNFASDGEPRSHQYIDPTQVLLSNVQGVWSKALVQRIRDLHPQFNPPTSGKHLAVVELSNISLAAWDSALVDLTAALAQLGGDADVSVHPNLYLLPTSNPPNDPLYAQQWSLPHTGVATAWQQTVGSPEVIVGIIDSGIDLSHPDFLHLDGTSNIWSNPAEIPDSGLDDDGNGLVDDVRGWDFSDPGSLPQATDNHGPRMAGVIGAAGNNNYGISGVNQRVSILPLRVGGTLFSTALVIEAIDYAIALKQAGHPLRVLNNSYAAEVLKSEITVAHPLRMAAQRATDAGILFVAAAGNSAFNMDRSLFSSTFVPAAFDLPGILTVAATTATDLLANFSNFGAESIDLGAPGSNILSTRIGGDHNLGSGSSEATAFVSAVAALLSAARPDLDAKALKKILMESGQPAASLAGKTVSGRRIQVDAAIAEAVKYPLPRWAASNPSFAKAGESLTALLEVDNLSAPLAETSLISANPAASWQAGSEPLSFVLSAAEPMTTAWTPVVVDTEGRRSVGPPLHIQWLSDSDFWLLSNFGDDLALPVSDDFWLQPTAAGVDRLAAYAFGWSPHGPAPAAYAASPPQLMRMQSTSGTPLHAFSFPISRHAPSVSWQVEYSTDLSAWSSVDAAALTPLVVGEEWIRYMVINEADSAAGFYRLRLQLSTDDLTE